MSGNARVNACREYDLVNEDLGYRGGVLDTPTSWPYTIPDEHKIDADKPSSESRFNLTHGFMWGKQW